MEAKNKAHREHGGATAPQNWNPSAEPKWIVLRIKSSRKAWFKVELI